MNGKLLIKLLAMLTVVGLMLPACGSPATQEQEGTTQAVEVEQESTEGIQAEQGSAPAPASGAKYGGSLRFGMTRDPTTYDPNRRGGITHSSFQGNIFDTLVEYDLKGDFVGALAESWEQPDEKTYIFKLRKGVKFHDGSDFDIQDVIATMNRIKDPDVAAQFQKYVESMTFEAVDDYTLRVVLPSPDATFLSLLASTSMYILSADDVDKQFEGPDEYNGTGPFMLDSWEPERQFVLKKNPNYWKEGLPYVDEVILMSMDEDQARVDALRSGELDVTEYVPWQDYEQLLQQGFVLFKHHGLLGFTMLNVNTPPLDNKVFRQALAYIVDTKAINELAFGGQAIPFTGPLQPPDSPYYFSDLEDYYVKDWDKARELLKEAGYDSPADVPPIQMKSRTTYYSAQPAKIIQQDMQEFGLTVEWETVGDTPTLVENRQKGTYQMHQDGRGLSWPDPDYLREFVHSEQGTGYAVGVGYKNERLDELLEMGHQTLDLEERKQIYHEAEQIILDEVPWLWTIWRVNADAVAPYVKGYEGYPSLLWAYNNARFEYIWLDK